VVLLLTLLILTAVLTAIFWGGSLLLQAWWYNVPASKLGLRSVGAALGVALFFTFWCWVDRKSPGKYSTLFEFSRYETEDFDKLTSVRKSATRDDSGKWKLGDRETKTAFTMKSGGRGTTDYFDKNNNQWKRSDTDGGMVVALLILEKDKDQPTRFNAELDPKTGGFPQEGVRFVEERGSRYIEGSHIGRVVRSRGSLVILNLLLNLAHFLVWLAAIWLGLRFTFWHAFGLAAGMWLAMTLVVLPVLFQQTRPSATPAAPKVAMNFERPTPRTSNFEL